MNVNMAENRIPCIFILRKPASGCVQPTRLLKSDLILTMRAQFIQCTTARVHDVHIAITKMQNSN